MKAAFATRVVVVGTSSHPGELICPRRTLDRRLRLHWRAQKKETSVRTPQAALGCGPRFAITTRVECCPAIHTNKMSLRIDFGKAAKRPSQQLQKMRPSAIQLASGAPQRTTAGKTICAAVVHLLSVAVEKHAGSGRGQPAPPTRDPLHQHDNRRRGAIHGR